MRGRQWARTLAAGVMALGVGSGGVGGVLTMPAVAGSGAASAVAWAAPAAADWELAPVTSVVRKLFAPSSGALLAWTSESTNRDDRGKDGLVRSDDGGASWETIPLPPLPTGGFQGRRLVEVDPVDHDVLYASGDEGLYQGSRDGAEWRVILPTSSALDHLAISAADHDLLYLSLDAGTGSETLMRSRDRGATWETLDGWKATGTSDRSARPCSGAGVLAPHPTDPARVYGSRACDLAESRDQGASWSTVLARDEAPVFGQVTELVGVQGAQPGRFYAVASATGQSRGRGAAPLLISKLLRSDDDGASWQVIASVENETGFTNLVADPIRPDRVFLGTGAPDIRTTGVSVDGGVSWSPLGARYILARSLVLGVDRRNLYAGDGAGVHRLALE